VDYLIRILTEDVELDFMRLHIRSGLGFKGHHLCKAEQEGKNIADSIPFDEAEASVEDLGNNELHLIFLKLDHLFTVFEAEGLIILQDEKIASCSCPHHTQSCLTCKHMFLVHQVTTYSISLPHTDVLGRWSREPQEEETIEAHQTSK